MDDEYLNKMLELKTKSIIDLVNFIFSIKDISNWSDEKVIEKIKEAVIYVNRV